MSRNRTIEPWALMRLFTKERPVLSTSDIGRELGLTDGEVRANLRIFVREKVIKKTKVSKKVFYSMPAFAGLIEDYIHEGDTVLVSKRFEWPKAIIRERKSWMDSALDFYRVLNMINIGELQNES